jgi:hypothetical protein
MQPTRPQSIKICLSAIAYMQNYVYITDGDMTKREL